MDDTTRALNWLTEHDESFNPERSHEDAKKLKRLYDRYDRKNQLSDALFLECLTLVRMTKATIILRGLETLR